jgi:DNA-binding LacI/PurR family transcriptional regulator
VTKAGDHLRRATSADVAREAGVSRATVSYVLNDTPHQKIPQATRQRVLDAADRLGYTPSAAARVLRSGRSDVVLLLLPDWPIGPSVGELLQELSARLAAAGLTFVAHPRGPGARPVGEVWKAITPAAVVAFDGVDEHEAAALRAAGIGLVVGLLDRSGRRGFELEVPQQRLGRLQVEHLAATGHRRIGYAWPADTRVETFARARLEGVRHACADLGLDEPEVRTVPLDAAVAAEVVRAWRTSQPPVSGVCAYNDDVALALLAGARGCHVAVPGDLAVIGVDDVPAAALVEPPLTTVVADQRSTARHLAASIVAVLEDRAIPRPQGSDTVGVVVRGSA